MVTVAVLLCLLASTLGLAGASCTRYTNITVSNSPSAADTPACLSGEFACRTLEFALGDAFDCIYLTINCSSPLVLRTPIAVQNISGLTLTGVAGGPQQQQVLCAAEAGLAFRAVSNVRIAGLEWFQCSAPHPTFSTSYKYSAVVFIESTNVTIEDVTFAFSNGTGLSLYNVAGKVTVKDSTFVGNSWKNSTDDSQGIRIEFGCYNSTCGMLDLNNSNALVLVENNSFALNNNPYLQSQKPYVGSTATARPGAGLTVFLGNHSSENVIRIADCKFENNSALSGGGMAVVVAEGATSNNIISKGSQFSFNFAAQAGGGIVIVYTCEESQNNSVTILASFFGNSASMGGGLSCISTCQPSPSHGNSINVTQSSFLANAASRGGSAVSVVTSPAFIGGIPLLVSMDHCNITGNTLSAYSSSSSLVGLGAVYLEMSSVSLCSVLFNQNAGTALFLSSSSVTLQGDVEFLYNYAVNGAGVNLYGTSWLNLTRGLKLHFEGNHALHYGGGVYQEYPLPGAVGEWWNCFLKYENSSTSIQDWDVSISFFNNSAQSGGSSIYTSNPENCAIEGDDPPFSNSVVYSYIGSSAAQEVSSPPGTIRINQGSTNIWEGQTLHLTTFASGYFNSSIGNVAIVAVDHSQSSMNISLGGVGALNLNSESTSTNFYITGPVLSDEGNPYKATVVIHSAQQPLAMTTVVFNVTQCPFGCQYNTTLKACACTSSSSVQCKNQECCIRYGYWYGAVRTSNGSYVYEGNVCPRGFCTYNGNGLCPQNQKCPFISGYCKLPSSQDGICANNRGGVLCSYCKSDNSFTYAATKCVDNSKCGPGYKVLLAFVILLYWAVLVGILVTALKYKIRVGSGHIYCVLYYFSIINYLVGNNYPTDFLQVTVDLITGIVLQPRFIGSMDVCVGEGISPLHNVALNYIHPMFLITFGVLILISARYFKIIANLRSTGQLVCYLILLSHTSLVETSVTILRPISYSDMSTVYVNIQPETEYFDPLNHLPFGIIALIVLLINIPFSFVLFFSPWMSKHQFFKMDKFKPILDEFQGCYKDECRCFAAFYLIAREIIYLVSLLPGLEVYGAIYTYQWISTIVIVIHAMVQPYKKRWLNILDTLLLANLVAVSLLFGGTAYSLFGQNNHSRNFHEFLVHIFVLMPIIYACTLGVQSIVKRIHKYIKSRNSEELDALLSVPVQNEAVLTKTISEVNVCDYQSI